MRSILYHSMNSLNRCPIKIVAGKPNSFIAWNADIGLYELDADSVSDGDILMCPIHPKVPVYVFGTDWWWHNGGTFERNATLHLHCNHYKPSYYCMHCEGRCKHKVVDFHQLRVETFSYRG